MTKKIVLDFLKGILAGMAIGLGGLLFILFSSIDTNIFIKIIASFSFSIGLFLVCTFKLNLYTGKIGVVFEKKQTSYFYILLPIMFLGNIIGAVGMGYLCYLIFGQTDILTTALSCAQSKLSPFTDGNIADYVATLLKAIGCGFFVYLAVKSFSLNRLKVVGISLLVIFVFFFVYFGFEHCIANMFYFSFANRWNANAFINIAIVVLGNSVGAIPGVLLFKAIKNQ